MTNRRSALPFHRTVSPCGAWRGGAGDLRGHVHQAVRDRRARGLRRFAGAGVLGGKAYQRQSRFRHGEFATTAFRPRPGVGNLRVAGRPAAKALRAQGAGDETGD